MASSDLVVIGSPASGKECVDKLYNDDGRNRYLKPHAMCRLNFAAFTQNNIYFCFNESDGQALCFRRHAFKDIHRVVRSDVEGELIYTAIDVSGNEMFKLSSLMMRPEGLDLAEVLDKRIQDARGAALA